MEKKELAKFLDETFLPLAFKRRGNNWIKNGDELSKIINLQKSNFGNSFYINYGFVIRRLKLTTTTHVEHRLASADKAEQKLINELLDLEIGIAPDSRLSHLRDFIRIKIIPLMQSINTEHDLFEYLKRRPHLYDVPLIVKRHFSLPLD